MDERREKAAAWRRFSKEAPAIAQQMREISARLGNFERVRLVLDGEVIYGPDRVQVLEDDWVSPVLYSRHIGRVKDG